MQDPNNTITKQTLHSQYIYPSQVHVEASPRQTLCWVIKQVLIKLELKSSIFFPDPTAMKNQQQKDIWKIRKYLEIKQHTP